MALTERHRNTLYQGLTHAIGDEEAVAAMLSHLPGREQDEPASKADLAAVESRLDQRMTTGFAATDTRITRLEAKVDSGFARFDGRFAQVDAHFDGRLAQVDARFDQVDARFAQVDARFDQVDARFDQVDARFEHFDARFDQVDARFEQVDARFEHFDARFDQVDAKVDGRLAAMTVDLTAALHREMRVWVRWHFASMFVLLAAVVTAAKILQ